jgi:pimeloyl-ACP methyl ester carboxylesterase
MMRYVLTLLLSLIMTPSFGADYEREKKWADEILPAVLVGDPVYLEQANHHKFLTLFAPVPDAKAAVVLVHGTGVHPDWGLIGMLRSQLADGGYATLSVQMPVLKADAKDEDYPPTFTEGSERLELAIDFLKAKGYKKIALVTHSSGGRITSLFLTKHPKAPVDAWVAIGMPEVWAADKVAMPVLDLYGQNDFPYVLKVAKDKARLLKGKGSKQIEAPGADHFFTGKDDALLEYVKNYLDETLK